MKLLGQVLDLKQAEISAFVRPCRQWLSRSIADKVTFRTTCERKFQIPMANGEKVFAVEHCFREAGAGGSNPLTPTSFSASNQKVRREILNRRL